MTPTVGAQRLKDGICSKGTEGKEELGGGSKIRMDEVGNSVKTFWVKISGEKNETNTVINVYSCPHSQSGNVDDAFPSKLLIFQRGQNPRLGGFHNPI